MAPPSALLGQLTPLHPRALPLGRSASGTAPCSAQRRPRPKQLVNAPGPQVRAQHHHLTVGSLRRSSAIRSVPSPSGRMRSISATSRRPPSPPPSSACLASAREPAWAITSSPCSLWSTKETAWRKARWSSTSMTLRGLFGLMAPLRVKHESTERDEIVFGCRSPWGTWQGRGHRTSRLRRSENFACRGFSEVRQESLKKTTIGRLFQSSQCYCSELTAQIQSVRKTR